MKKRERVYLKFIRDYVPEGWDHPLHRAGERTWIDGIGVREVAHAFISSGYARMDYNAARADGQVLVRGRRPGFGPKTQRIAERLKAGESVVEIARSLGMSHQAVREVKKRAGLTKPRGTSQE